MFCALRVTGERVHFSAIMKRLVTPAAASLVLWAGLTSCGPAEERPAQSLSEFYRGKTLTIIVGFTPGGVYDVSARVLARHLGKYIPGHPSIVVQNMPGAGSLTAASYVYDVAPKDGTVIGLYADGVPLAPLWRLPGAHFDPRSVGWLGALTVRDTSVILVRGDAPAKSFEDAKHIPVVLGSAGSNGINSTVALMLNDLLGTKFKVVTGYPGYAETMLALERGEVQGRAATGWDGIKREKPEWVATGFVRPLVQLTVDPIPGLEHIPRALDLVENESDRQLIAIVLESQKYSHVYSVAAGVPDERLALLRTAFAATASDPDFIADAKRLTTDKVRFTDYRAIEEFIRMSYALPEHIRSRASVYAGGQ